MSNSSITIPIDSLEHLLLNHVSWHRYGELLEEFEQWPGMRLTFNRGQLEVIAPTARGEFVSRCLSRLVSLLCLERRIPICGLGSTTFRDERVSCGVEPAECIYIEHSDAARSIRGPFDPTRHPPPDIAVSVQAAHRVIALEPIYAALGVPEVWHVGPVSLECLRLERGQYRRTDRSLALPFLAPSSLWDWIERLTHESDVVVLHDFVNWAYTLD